MAQSFDVTFKLLFGDVAEWTNVELPEVRPPRLDLLARCADGSYCHVEINMRNESNFDFRMLDYYVAARRVIGEHIRQTLLYIGREPLRIKGVFESPSTRHEYTIINLREMDGAELLASNDWADNESALLTKTDPEKVIRVVFDKIRALTGEEQEKAATTFVILSGIIGMEDEVEGRFKTDMIDLMENKILGPAIRQGMEQGRATERRELLQGILEDRFGQLPNWAEAKLAAATPETLKAWSHRLRADSLEDLLA